MPISHFTPENSELERLKYELEYSRILVEVTNTVIARRELPELAKHLSDELNFFFKFGYIGLELFDSTNKQFYSYSAQFSDKTPTHYYNVAFPAKGKIIDAVFYRRTPLKVERDTLSSKSSDSYIQSLLKSNLKNFYLLPLCADEKTLGILRLGSNNEHNFTERNRQLLQQIAARISIGLDNALAYQEISRLKDNLITENLYLTEEIKNFEKFDEIIGESELMSQTLEQVEMVAGSDCTVLILGETGTGKELIARAIHKLSPRSEQKMVKMNCAAIPASLMESDLFGHERGAFTGATNQRIGRFELAHKGSLFLDEVGDIPLELQPKLLRVLQEREIERVGGNKIIPVDVRVIAATNCDLKQMVDEKRYRSDLYYRLNVFPIVVPPLRERPEDIPLLAQFFTKKIARRMNRHIESIPADALKQLAKLPWTGNVRELENIIERAVILTKGEVLNLQLEGITPPPKAPSVVQSKKEKVVKIASTKKKANTLADDDEQEREMILQVLRETNGIVAGPKGAAIRLGLKRTTLLSRMQRLGISVKDIDNLP